MQIKKIKSGNPKEVEKFIKYPFKLYRSNPVWVPRMVQDVRFALNKKENPFYESSEADFFIVENDEEVLGRIGVLRSRNYNEFHGTKAAQFYFFDAVPERRVTELLFDTAFSWAHERNLKVMIGPLGMHAGDGHGILVEGFSRRPGMGIPYNYSYYRDLLEEVGFEKLVDSVSGQVRISPQTLQTRFKDKLEKIKRVARKVKEHRGFQVLSFTNTREIRENLDQFLPQLKKVYNESFRELPLYHPMSENGMRRVVNRFLAIADPRLIKLVVKEKDLVGFILIYPNITPAIRKVRGRMSPLNKAYLWTAKKLTRWIDFNGIGVLPEKQGVGANTILYNELRETLERFSFEWGIVNQVSEKNEKNLRELAGFGVEFDRRHRVFKRKL